jgi:hypothetical protein
MVTGAIVILTVFYAGAVCASGYSWFCVWRGEIGFSALRDVTGINDRGALRRLFGLTRVDGTYQVTFAAVLRHRRKAGIILTDLPVHLLFLAALLGAALLATGPIAAAVICAAAAHALLIGGAALSVLVGGYQALPD